MPSKWTTHAGKQSTTATVETSSTGNHQGAEQPRQQTGGSSGRKCVAKTPDNGGGHCRQVREKQNSPDSRQQRTQQATDRGQNKEEKCSPGHRHQRRTLQARGRRQTQSTATRTRRQHKEELSSAGSSRHMSRCAAVEKDC